jgi:hypothetical protein
MTRLPQPRGPLSGHLTSLLATRQRGPRRDVALADLLSETTDALERTEDLLRDEDVQVALYVMYELAYRGFDGVDDAWEWDVELLRARAAIEERLEAELRARVPMPQRPDPNGDAVAAALFALTAEDGSPGLSHFIAKRADVEQLRELLVHRSVYQLKEADPHTWAIPRLSGVPKAALVEVQADEYGGGRPERMHSALFARSMRALRLDDGYGRYVDEVPAITLAWVNVMSMFGLHRRWRGAICGHLAALEMTSSLPNRRYGNGFRRNGFNGEATEYFDEHVEADAVHEQIAGRDLAGALVEHDPTLLDDVLFGAAVCLVTDAWVAEHLLDCWREGRSSLRLPMHAEV